MNKAGRWLVMVGLLVSGAKAQMISFEGINEETVTTGNLLEDVRNFGITTNVQEIGGLIISARSGGSEQKLNANNDFFGVDSDGSSDVADAFEVGEKMVVSFNKDIRITRIDFNRLGGDETFSVGIDGQPIVVARYDDLAHKSFGYFDTDLTISAGTEIEFYTTGDSVVGLDGIDVSVLNPRREFDLSVVHSNGMAHVTAKFNETATTNYVLQSCNSLTSNVWKTVSSSFASSTNWTLETPNDCGFYRVIAE